MTTTIPSKIVDCPYPKSIYKEYIPHACSLALAIIWMIGKLFSKAPRYFRYSTLPLIALPAFLKWIIPRIVHPASNNDQQRQTLARYFPILVDEYLQDYQLKKVTFQCRTFVLGFPNISYDALIVEKKIGKANTPQEEIWQICTYGNGEGYEYNLADARKTSFNILFINGPGVGESVGNPNRTLWGYGVVCALKYLEKRGVKHIFLFGRSLGGGAIAEAILQHTLEQDVSYYMVADRTFCHLSTEAGHLIATKVFGNLPIISPIVQRTITSCLWTLDVELDCVNAAKKLLTNNHYVFVFQNINDVEGDGVIMTAATLSKALADFFSNSNLILTYGSYGHNDNISDDIYAVLQESFKSQG